MPEKKLNEEQKTLVRALIIWLARKYDRWSREVSSQLRDKVIERFAPATTAELEYLFSRADGDVSKIHKYIFLEPLGADNSVLPVASISCNFRKKVPEVRIQLGLFTLDNDTVRAIGLRLETPEGHGAHNYYHCQFITGYRDEGDGASLPIGCWLPTKDPTLLLGAKNSVGLMVCLIAALYGRTEVDTLVHQNFYHQLKRYIQHLPWEESKSMGKNHHDEDEHGRWHCSV